MTLSPSLKALSSRSSSVVSINRKLEPLLPCSLVPEKGAKIRVRTLLGHCHYRRVFLWTLTLTFIVILALVKSKTGGKGYDIGGYHFGGTKTAPVVKNITNIQTTTKVYYDAGTPIVFLTGDLNGDGQEEYITEENLTEEQKKHLTTVQRQFTPWIRFPHLNGYFNGIKTIVNKAHLVPEYPNITEKAPLPPPINEHDAPKPAPYNPYTSSKHINTCYLDLNETIPAPDIYAYNGVPQDMPDPALGSYELLGMRDDVCFDRFSRYGPYGLGYSKIRGGSGSGIDTESEGSEEVWAKSGKIDYSNMDWGDAQERCFKANKHRFQQVDDDTGELQNIEDKKARTAVVIRSYTGFRWTEHAILNFRALINELSLRSGGEYHVHFLVQVRDETAPIFSDDQTAQRIIDENVPAEFRSLVTLWSEPQMKLFYPGAFPDPVFNPSGQDIHGIYRSAHFPLQVFALHHPEYEHFWNWEMDMRYLGSYYEFFDRIGKWSAEQPRPFMWERSARYYIPSYHGTWENFTKTVQQDTLNSGRPTVFGPVNFEGKGQLQYEFEGKSVMPASCSSSADNSKCGVGEDADLITLNPLFDTEESGWFFANDVTGYMASTPRRCAIITAGRLSRRLLMAMHEEVWRHHHTMFSEMFPPSVALHHGFKALYAPHPIYLERAWYPYSDIDSAFNGGRDHSTSGQGSPFDLRNEHNHKGTSWYYHSEWAGMLWRRWLGYAQRDGRGDNGGRLNTGEEKGGKLQEMDARNTGRMCLRGMLVHPIKYEHPSESAAQPYQ